MKKLLLKLTLFVAAFCFAALPFTNAQTTLLDVDGKLHVNSAGNVGIG
ncbi:MAG: hypothetical protein HKN75_01135, partial [Bacteroidia bacterium]|nr:hypothetical protein [Bacteroidia bacterium]